jgi:hypothetical protein
MLQLGKADYQRSKLNMIRQTINHLDNFKTSTKVFPAYLRSSDSGLDPISRVLALLF